MTIRIDLRGIGSVPERRRSRALAEAAAIAAAVPADRLELVASGEAAFMARLVARPGNVVRANPGPQSAAVVYRAFGEVNPASLDAGVVLVEVADLGRIVDRVDGPARGDAVLDARLQEMAGANGVVFRTAADWQSAALRRSLGIAASRILCLPAAASVPSEERLASIRLPDRLPPDFLLCLTPVGAAGDLGRLVRVHGALGRAVPPLVVAGVDDEAWRPALTAAVERAGTAGRVLILRDLDPVSEAAAIARAGAVVAIDRHPAHAVRLRRAAWLQRPAAVRRHPGHDAWVEGGGWFDDDDQSLSAALLAPSAIRLRQRDADAGSIDALTVRLMAAMREAPVREEASWGP